MRSALLALCLIGCFPPAQDDEWDPPRGGSWGSGWGGGGGTTGLGCETDAECGSQICARTGECISPSLVRATRTIWTVNDALASDTSCTRARDLAITFYAGQEQFGFTPVPCDAGKFTVDKLPTRFTSVELSRRDDFGGGAFGSFDIEGTATLDLPY